jgi:putative hemolysin
LELIRKTRFHTILVVDEYGSVIGLITPTDVLEFIVGQLPSLELTEEAEPAIRQRADGSWLIDGMIPLQDLAAGLPASNPFTTIRTRLQTLNGFMMQQLGHIPSTGETFEWSGYRFEVVDMDGNRVDKVLVSQIPEADIMPQNPDTPDSTSAP